MDMTPSEISPFGKQTLIYNQYSDKKNQARKKNTYVLQFWVLKVDSQGTIAACAHL